MRFACLTAAAPGDDLAAKCAAIAAGGCQGVETLVFPHDDLTRWQAELRRAADDAGLAVAAVILGGLALYVPGQEGWIAEAMQAVAELGAGVLMTPEFRAQDPLPLFPPHPLPPAAEAAQVERTLVLVDGWATQFQVPVLLEPLTAFEGRFWRSVADVLAVCTRLDNPLVGIALDFHNMNITEANIAASILDAGEWVRHVHLADNNRRLPGAGHIDFRSGLAALQAIGYDGWYSFECAVDGEFSQALRRTQTWLYPALS